MTTFLVPREQLKRMLSTRIEAGEELLRQSEIAERAGGHRDWNYLFSTWRKHTLAELRAVYDGPDVPAEFEYATLTAERSSARSAFPYEKAALEDGLQKLRQLVERLPLGVGPDALQSHPAKAQSKVRNSNTQAVGRNIFIVHGRTAGGFRDSVARFIEQLGLSPVILADRANEGRTLIEKFEANALDVGFAIALLTPEDTAYDPADEPPPRPNRARQNVILELGYFMASLGRKNVVALQQEGLELPTDILGIVYIPLDESGAWKTLLARELLAAGYEIDLGKLLG